MLPEMFFNELSLLPLAADVPAGRERAEQFVTTLRAATMRGIQRTLRVPESFFTEPVARGYYWQNWLNDNRVDREIRQFFRSLATKLSFLRDEPDAEAGWKNVDCLWQNQLSLGLKAAYVADGLAVSVLSIPQWDTPWIECDIHELVDENIDSRPEILHHAASTNHLDPHMGWIQHRIRDSVEDGRELWQRFSDLFPLLGCCQEVEEQMVNLPVPALPSIARGLFYLNAFCVGWQSRIFNPDGIQCAVSPESAPTLIKYSAERTFLCPDGEQRTFTWHAKVGSWRIYFDPAPGPGHLFVGYVGKHLRTVKFH
jgi:hypothetical protein